MRQIHSNLYSCSAKLLWVFKLTVMFSNWNINLFKPLIWLPQWRITKYFIVSDLLKFYKQFPLSCTFYSRYWKWGSLSLSPGGCSRGLSSEFRMSTILVLKMSSRSRIPTTSLWSEATDASLMYPNWDFSFLVLAMIRYIKPWASFSLYYQSSWHSGIL